MYWTEVRVFGQRCLTFTAPCMLTGTHNPSIVLMSQPKKFTTTMSVFAGLAISMLRLPKETCCKIAYILSYPLFLACAIVFLVFGIVFAAMMLPVDLLYRLACLPCWCQKNDCKGYGMR